VTVQEFVGDFCTHVTVLIPDYNRERYILDAIDSVIAQDYSDWDILIVDDGSNDRWMEVVKSRMSDDRISLIHMEHGGPVAATAMGIEHARGPVITCLDSDDKLMPGALSAVMPSFEKNPRLGYVWTNWVDSTGDKGSGDFLPEGKTLIEAVISGWWKGFTQRFFRKEFYLQTERLDTSTKYLVGVPIALLIAKTGCDTLHIPKVTYWRRIHPHRFTNGHYADELEEMHLLRRKYSSGNATLTELYTVGLEKEMDALRSELMGIKKCFGYKFMGLYGSIIDQTLPDGTRRGELKRRVVDSLRGSS